MLFKVYKNIFSTIESCISNYSFVGVFEWWLWNIFMQIGHALSQIHLSCVYFDQTIKRQKCINSEKMFKRVYKRLYGAHHDTTTARWQRLLPHQFSWLIKLNLKSISDRGNWKKLFFFCQHTTARFQQNQFKENSTSKLDAK